MTRNDTNHEISTIDKTLLMASGGMSDAAINVLAATAHCWGVEIQSFEASTSAHVGPKTD